MMFRTTPFHSVLSESFCAPDHINEICASKLEQGIEREGGQRAQFSSNPQQTMLGKGESDSEPVFQPYGNRAEGIGENHRRGALERPQYNGAAVGKDPGAASAGERSI